MLGGATALVLLSTILLGKLIPVTELARESCPIHLIKPKLKKASQYSVVYSSLVLKEISIRQQRTKMFAGLIMGVMGIILLGLARI